MLFLVTGIYGTVVISENLTSHSNGRAMYQGPTSKDKTSLNLTLHLGAVTSTTQFKLEKKLSQARKKNHLLLLVSWFVF